ncbi:acyltransferase family protein [Flavobacterium sp. TP390]|uniref:Acyltransferase family protein n=1 Tax=Flavobacterium profundi TaxID=1774945 RepID=A0A6I4IUC5_9FLAO|nr:acyltransferase family protein [Flavobacterium profundi]
MKILPNITPLRFFLALFVILYHLPQYCANRCFPYYNKLPIFFKGDEAVYVFFSLSGFLIIRNLIIEKDNNNTIDLKKFFSRRALRIFPLYYLVLIFGFIFYEFVAPNFGYIPDNNYNLVFGIFLGFTFFANILATFKPGGILEILWSIGIEEQFYIIIAPILYKLKAKYFLIFFLTFTLLYFYIFHFCQFIPLQKYLMYFYFFSFSGVIAFISIKKNTILFSKPLKIITHLLFFLLFFTDIINDNFETITYHFICMLTFPIFIGILTTTYIPFLNNKYLNYFGKISYGIYMYHAIIFQFIGLIFLKSKITNHISENLSIFIFYFSSIICTIILSHFSYIYFERKFIRLKKY